MYFPTYTRQQVSSLNWNRKQYEAGRITWNELMQLTKRIKAHPELSGNPPPKIEKALA